MELGNEHVFEAFYYILDGPIHLSAETSVSPDLTSWSADTHSFPADTTAHSVDTSSYQIQGPVAIPAPSVARRGRPRKKRCIRCVRYRKKVRAIAINSVATANTFKVPLFDS